jgi:hypothetical protein
MARPADTYKSILKIDMCVFRPGAHIMSHTNPLRGLGALAIGLETNFNAVSEA